MGPGSAEMRARNDASTRSGAVSGAAGAGSCAVPAANAASASGLPPDSSMIRSRCPGATSRAPSSIPASSRPSRPGLTSVSPGARKSSSRAANAMTTPSAVSRRAAKSSACARGRVHPVRVVQQAQDRAVLRGLGEQGQHGETGEEPVVRPGPALPQRRVQRSRLRLGQRVDEVSDRTQ